MRYRYISQSADHSVVSRGYAAHRPSFGTHHPRWSSGGWGFRGLSRIPESFTLRDWPGGRSCVRSRKSPRESSSWASCDVSVWSPPSFPSLSRPCIPDGVLSLFLSLPYSDRGFPVNAVACVERLARKSTVYFAARAERMYWRQQVPKALYAWRSRLARERER